MSERGPSWGALLAFGAATRLATLLFGYVTCQHMPPLIWKTNEPAPQTVMETFYCWDAIYYLRIAEQGYDYGAIGIAADGSITGGGTAAFMPGLPVCMIAANALGIDLPFAGLLIPNAAFALGLAFFGRYLHLIGCDSGTIWRSCTLLAAYPTAFFFSLPYQESLGFAGVAVALWAWQRERPGLAAAGILFASFARLTALAFPAALAVEWLANRFRGRPTRPLGSIILVALAWAIAVGIFLAYLHFRFGDAMAHFKSHRQWNRLPPNPLNLIKTLEGIGTGFVEAGITLALFTALGVRAWWKRGPFLGMLILVPLMQATFTGTPISLERIVLASFPAFLDLAELLKRPAVYWTVIVSFLVMQALLFNACMHGHFVA